MAFSYNPKDADGDTFPIGDYPAVLEKVEEKTSKKGDAMLVVTLRAYNGDRQTFVTDYIVNPSSLWKLKKVAQALGALQIFKDGTFDLDQHLGQNLTITLGIEEAKGDFAEKNTVKGYKAAAPAGAFHAPKVAAEIDPDIPF